MIIDPCPDVAWWRDRLNHAARHPNSAVPPPIARIAAMIRIIAACTNHDRDLIAMVIATRLAHGTRTARERNS